MLLIKDLGMEYTTKNSKTKRRFGIYQCPKCFINFRANTSDVKSKHTTKCRKCSNTKHGLINHKLYNTWNNQKYRCNNVSHRDYKHYGERGIMFSNKFNDFLVWLKYVESLPNAHKENYTIDRVDNNASYEPMNLRWTSKSIQARNTKRLHSTNKSGYRGVSITINKKWVSRIQVSYKTIHLGTFEKKWTAAYAYDAYILKNKLEHTKNFS